MSLTLPSHIPNVAVPTERQPVPPVTARTVWVVLLMATAVGLLVRLPELQVLAEQTLVARASRDVASDPLLRRIAFNTGLWMALFLSLVVAALYLSLVSAMERHLLPVSRGGGRLRIGLLFCVAALATVPADLYCAATGTLTLRGSEGYGAYLVAVGLLVPLGFWPTLARLKTARRCVVFGLSVFASLLSYVV